MAPGLSDCRQRYYTDVERRLGLGRVFVDVRDAEHGSARVADAVHQTSDDEEVQRRMSVGCLLDGAAACR